jgi:hypothetical protein
MSMALNLYFVLLFLYWPYIVPPRSSVVFAATGRGDKNVHQDEVAVVFGHVHLAKTAGTEINGELASHFERVCGHKGYSYDAYQFNKRVSSNTDSVSHQYRNYDRGRIPNRLMREIGFEDCDYISLEENWQTWKSFKKTPSLELHVPCRDPLTHLMSQCNHKEMIFNCTTDNLPVEINKCLLQTNRFSRDLEKLNNTNIKCFNPIPIEPYLEYMSERLQRKRIENTYVHRDSNGPHKKEDECIWYLPDIANQVRAIMLERHDLYGWCNTCLGSKDDLLATGSILIE